MLQGQSWQQGQNVTFAQLQFLSVPGDPLLLQVTPLFMPPSCALMGLSSSSLTQAEFTVLNVVLVMIDDTAGNFSIPSRDCSKLRATMLNLSLPLKSLSFVTLKFSFRYMQCIASTSSPTSLIICPWIRPWPVLQGPVTPALLEPPCPLPCISTWMFVRSGETETSKTECKTPCHILQYYFGISDIFIKLFF